jgi:hypothetical protein
MAYRLAHPTAFSGFSPFIVLILTLLAGCSTLEEHRVGALVENDATPAAFRVCHGSNCRIETPVDLDDAAWNRVRALFDPASQSAAEERRRVADAVGLMERLVAKQAGTAKDVGRNLTVADQSTQLDCVDEAVNSTTYLRMFAAGGLLRYHSVDPPAHRGGVILAHNTAVLRELATGRRYAIDSWFYDNGAPAMVLPLQTWLDGWEPGDGPSLAAGPAPASSPLNLNPP